MILAITYSSEARLTLRNLTSAHEDTVVRRFGRVAIFEATEHGAFLAMRLREKHDEDVQIERITPFNEFIDVPEHIRDAARAYEARESISTPYTKFAVGTDHPAPEEMQRSKL